MFKVREKKSGRELVVYAVVGGMFLLYDNGHWYWDDMGFYTPVEDEE